MFVFFFFQAEDGIRDLTVTGVQTCALPIFEDQVHPKRCGHMPGKEVIPLVEGAKKIEAACLARKSDAFAIIARTDALAVEGVEGMLRRARAYAQAGADLIFADAIRSEDEIKRLVDAARVP